MLRFRPSLMVGLLVAVVFSGCLGDDDADEGGAAGVSWNPDRTPIGEPLTVASGPAGDAFIVTGRTPYDLARSVALCRVFNPVMSTCNAVPAEVAQNLEGIELVPAEPEMDLLSLTVTETANMILFDIEVAELRAPSSFLGGLPGEMTLAGWDVYWETDDGRDGAAYVWQSLNGDGYHSGGAVDSYCADLPGCDTGCNWWWWCSTEIDAEYVTGAPGHVILEVPRALATGFDRGVGLTYLSAGTSAQLRSGDDDVPTPVITAGVPATGVGASLGAYFLNTRIDEVVAGSAYTPMASAPGKILWPDSIDWPQGDAHDDLDVVRTQWQHTAEGISLTVELAEVAETAPSGFYVYVGLGMPSGSVYDWMAYEDGGAYAPYAGRPTDVAYDGYVEMGSGVEVVAGSPGTITLTLAHAEMDAFAAGEAINLFMLATGKDPPGIATPDNPAIYAAVSGERTGSDYMALPPYVLMHGNDAA